MNREKDKVKATQVACPIYLHKIKAFHSQTICLLLTRKVKFTSKI
jgi:hypothetical protein